MTRRPPPPTHPTLGTPCPTCGKSVPASCHDGCPVLVKRRKEIADIERLFGLEPLDREARG